MGRALRWGALAVMLLASILVPFALWGGRIEMWVEAFAWGPVNPTEAIAVLAALLALDGFLPVPSSLAATLLGRLLGVAQGTLVSTAAMTVGALLSYLLGRWGGRPVARRLIGEEAIRRVAGWLSRNGVWALALCRPLPVLAEASVVVAGLTGMRACPVLTITALSNLGLNAVYAGVGAAAGRIETFLLAVIAAFILPGLALLVALKMRRT